MEELLPGLLYGSDHLKNSKEHVQRRNKNGKENCSPYIIWDREAECEE